MDICSSSPCISTSVLTRVRLPHAPCDSHVRYCPINVVVDERETLASGKSSGTLTVIDLADKYRSPARNGVRGDYGASGIRRHHASPKRSSFRPSRAQRSCTGKSCNFRDRRSSLHLHGTDSLTGPSMIFASATGSCSSLPGPDSDLADARALVFRATASSSTMISTALPGDSFSIHFSSVDFPLVLYR